VGVVVGVEGGGWLGWWGVAIMIEAQAKAKHCKPKWHD
jgi:hypothetical protein